MTVVSDVPVFYDCEASCIGGLPIEIGCRRRMGKYSAAGRAFSARGPRAKEPPMAAAFPNA